MDEYTLCQQAPNAEQILQTHWSTWTGLGDFQKVAGAGFNTVRIPVGYWAFQKYEGDPYIMGAQEYPRPSYWMGEADWASGCD